MQHRRVTEAQHVVAVVIVNSANEILLSLRPAHVHQAGLWEFPGGKVEAGEDARRALVRELGEELGIEPVSVRPMIRIRHDFQKHGFIGVVMPDADHRANADRLNAEFLS